MANIFKLFMNLTRILKLLIALTQENYCTN